MKIQLKTRKLWSLKCQLPYTCYHPLNFLDNFLLYLERCKNVYLCVWQYTRSPLSQPPKPLMRIRSSRGFSHLRPRAFHIALQTHNTHHIHNQEGGRKEGQTSTTLGWLQAQEGRIFNTFVWFSCASMSHRKRVFKRNSHTATRNADSSSHVGQPGLWVHRS